MSPRTCIALLAGFSVVAICSAPHFPLLYLPFSGICHQIPDRCFRLSGIPLAVCARCLGFYAGTLAAALIPARRRDTQVLLALLVVNMIDYATGYAGNELRFLLASLLCWIAVSDLIALASREAAESN